MAAGIEKVAIACLVALLGYYTPYYIVKDKTIYNIFFSREHIAISKLDHIIGNSTSSFKKVAVGVNANVDLITSAKKTFNQLGIVPSGNAHNHGEISTLEQLEECFSYHFKKCAAAERFITSKVVFDEIVKAARSVNGSQFDVGGNAALMGLKMLYSNPDSTVLLGGPIGPKLKLLLDERILIPENLQQTEDEYHLILEYQKGESWGDLESTCANRFIISHDKSNGEMAAMDRFFDSLEAFNPELVVISGLHLLEGQSHIVKKEKIEKLRAHLRGISPDIPIHLELASMTSRELMEDIALLIFPMVDSVGLNEQELTFLSLSLNGPGGQDELSQNPPEIGLMADILDWTLNSFGVNTRYGGASSRLTRVHFHCLVYHITCIHEGYWGNNLVATAAGSRAASKQACDDEKVSVADVELRTPKYFARSVNNWFLRRNLVKRDEGNPVIHWQNNDLEFHFSAVLVCKKPKRTVGLGDCISATGLQHSHFLQK